MRAVAGLFSMLRRRGAGFSIQCSGGGLETLEVFAQRPPRSAPRAHGARAGAGKSLARLCAHSDNFQ